jgi:adenylate cyclase class 2
MTETEVKIRLVSWEDGEERLARVGAKLREKRYFERNTLFDFPERSLTERGEALRLRQARGRAWLTFKGPMHGGGRIKKRKEYETVLEDGDATREILQALRMSETFRYEKFRAVYAVGDLLVCLDEVPMGFFMELEGASAHIVAGLQMLKFSMDEAFSATYPRLWQLHRDEFPDAPEDMIFPEIKT